MARAGSRPFRLRLMMHFASPAIQRPALNTEKTSCSSRSHPKTLAWKSQHLCHYADRFRRVRPRGIKRIQGVCFPGVSGSYRAVSSVGRLSPREAELQISKRRRGHRVPRPSQKPRCWGRLDDTGLADDKQYGFPRSSHAIDVRHVLNLLRDASRASGRSVCDFPHAGLTASIECYPS